MPYETVRCEVDELILTITLNRPDKLNAFTTQMLHEMIDAFDRADKDDAVRAVIVTGAGRAFCAGARPLRRRCNLRSRVAHRPPADSIGPGR